MKEDTITISLLSNLLISMCGIKKKKNCIYLQPTIKCLKPVSTSKNLKKKLLSWKNINISPKILLSVLLLEHQWDCLPSEALPVSLKKRCCIIKISITLTRLNLPGFLLPPSLHPECNPNWPYRGLELTFIYLEGSLGFLLTIFQR